MKDLKVIISVVDSVDDKIVYGALKVPYSKIEKIQTEIDAIKYKYYKEQRDWTVEDVINELTEKHKEIEEVSFMCGDTLRI